MSTLNRRDLIRLGLLTSAQLLTLGCRPRPGAAPSPEVAAPSPEGPTAPTLAGLAPDFGPLVPDPNKVLDLPEGWRCAVLQTSGDPLSGGFVMPGEPDGMTCHIDDQGRYVLLRNHELGSRAWVEDKYKEKNEAVPAIYPDGQNEGAYRPGNMGGVCRVVLDPDALAAALDAGTGDASAAVVVSNMVLTGTLVNCSGGAIPGGWVSCEETDAEEHGYAFLAYITDEAPVDTASRRLTHWGRFKREGVAVRPDGAAIYMTEDHNRCRFYRFVPDDPSDPLRSPGKLQALSAEGLPDADPETALTEGSQWPVTWVDVPDPTAAEAPCRAQVAPLGATRFNRTEGLAWDGEAVWFVASLGGPAGAGQVFRYSPADGLLTLARQVTDRAVLSMPDNITMAPWGGLVLAEDNYSIGGGCTHQHMRWLAPDGVVHDLARNPLNAVDDAGSELAGVCFSPDGRYLFVNLQRPRNITVAISGPWPDAAG